MRQRIELKANAKRANVVRRIFFIYMPQHNNTCRVHNL
jgi:hypothetical protein